MQTRRSVVKTGVALVATIHGGFARSQPAAKSGGVLRIGSSNMRTLNSAIQPGNATGLPAAQLFAGLVELDANFQPTPYLAKSWEVSPDGLNYSFDLIDGATFHDGRPITAKDVVFSIETVRASHPLMSVAYGAVIDSVVASKPLSVQIKLKQPFGGMFSALASALTPILPEHVYGQAAGPIQQNPANAKPIGSGPYKFVEWKAGERLSLQRYDGYFRNGRPYFDRLEFMITDDPLIRTLALEKGDIDFLPFSFLRVNELARMKANPAMVVATTGYGALGPINYLEFNLRDPLLSDLRVRQAIAHTIDKDFICKTLHRGFSKRLDGPIHSGSPMFDASALTTHAFNLQKASELLDAAGMKRAGDGTRTRLTLDLPPFEPDSSQLVGEYVRAQLKKVGIEVTLRSSADLADWASKVGQWNYQLTMNSTWNYPDPLIGVHRSFLSSNIRKVIWSNTEGYSNSKVDELLVKAATEKDPVTRKKLYREFQQIVTTELPFVWTNEGIYTTVSSKKLTGLPAGALGVLAPLDQIRFA